jgi:hypothetical protein
LRGKAESRAATGNVKSKPGTHPTKMQEKPERCPGAPCGQLEHCKVTTDCNTLKKKIHKSTKMLTKKIV